MVSALQKASSIEEQRRHSRKVHGKSEGEESTSSLGWGEWVVVGCVDQERLLLSCIFGILNCVHVYAYSKIRRYFTLKNKWELEKEEEEERRGGRGREILWTENRSLELSFCTMGGNARGIDKNVAVLTNQVGKYFCPMMILSADEGRVKWYSSYSTCAGINRQHLWKAIWQHLPNFWSVHTVWPSDYSSAL